MEWMQWIPWVLFGFGVIDHLSTVKGRLQAGAVHVVPVVYLHTVVWFVGAAVAKYLIS